MGNYSWDYNKLPDHEIPTVEKALEAFDLETLFNLYYDYKLGETKYCCPNPVMFNFYNDLIEKRK
jgi:hypothetical protein